MRMNTARYMSGDMTIHLSIRSRGVSDPWGRGWNQPAGRGWGSLTPRLRYPSKLRGRQRTPANCRRASSLRGAEVVAIAAVTWLTATFERAHSYLPSDLTTLH